MRPSLAEIEATISRMEIRHRDSPLFRDYLALVERFATDLDDPRDLALSKAAALMLIKYAKGERS
jgi:hypothetical protein